MCAAWYVVRFVALLLVFKYGVDDNSSCFRQTLRSFGERGVARHAADTLSSPHTEGDYCCCVTGFSLFVTSCGMVPRPLVPGHVLLLFCGNCLRLVGIGPVKYQVQLMGVMERPMVYHTTSSCGVAICIDRSGWHIRYHPNLAQVTGLNILQPINMRELTK